MGVCVTKNNKFGGSSSQLIRQYFIFQLPMPFFGVALGRLFSTNTIPARKKIGDLLRNNVMTKNWSGEGRIGNLEGLIGHKFALGTAGTCFL